MNSRKIEIKWKMIKRDMLKHWPIWVTSFVVYVFVVFLVNSFARGFISTATKYEVTTTIIGSLIELTLVLAFCMGFIAAWASFGFLENKKKDYFYVALPFSKLSLFINKYLFGLLLCMLPCLAMFFIELIHLLVLSGSLQLILLLKWLVTAFIEYFFWYSFGVLFMVLCGRILMAGYCFLMFSFAGLVLRFFLEMSNLLCFIGVNGGLGNGESVLGIFSTIEYIFRIEIVMFRFGYSEMDPTTIFVDGATGKFIVILVAGMILTAASYLLFAKRKEERTGDNIVFNGMKIVFSSVLTFFATIYLVMALYLIIFYNKDELAHKLSERIKIVILLAVIGFVCYLISSMIVEKKIKIFKSHWLKSVIFAMVVSLIGIGYLHDVFNIESYVPKAEEVESIYINRYDTIFEEIFLNNTNKRGITVTNKESIAVISELHKIIVDNIEATIDPSYDQYSFNFTYRLKNGSQIARHYNVPYNSELYYKLKDYIMKNMDILATGFETYNQEYDEYQDDVISSVEYY